MTRDNTAQDSQQGGETEVLCPTCGREDFSSEMGMKIHHQQAHDESIAKTTLTCEWCGDDFQYRSDRADERRFCSEECENEWKSESDFFSGKNNPSWDGGKESIKCQQCGDEIEVYPSEQGRKYCSEECMADAFAERPSEWYSKYRRVTLECEVCGDEYEVKPYRADKSRFCSQECNRQYLSNQDGADHRWWKGGKTTLTCEMCGDEFEVKQNLADERRFCSVECMGEWRSMIPSEEHPNWEGGKATLLCDQCGDEFEVFQTNTDRRFCSEECMGEWYSIHQSGQDHPGWRGGKSVYDAVKTLISDEQWENISRRHRDEEPACQMCGAEENLHTHHIIPIMAGGTNEAWNLMTLCISCHNLAESFTREFAPAVLVEP